MTESVCPEWCQHHNRTDYADGSYVLSHQRVLWRNPLPISPDRYSLLLYVDRTDVVGVPGYEGGFPPQLCLVEGGKGAMPRTIEPEQAKALAAALIEGVEAVELLLTAKCAECGRAVMPHDADQCANCEIEERRRVRRSIKAVPELGE